MLKFAFITTRRTNIGDDFVREGLRAVLDELCEYRTYIVHKHDPDTTCKTPYPEDDGPPLNDKLLDADAIFQTGAPVYWNLGNGPGQKCDNAEWVGPLWYERIAHVHRTIPVFNIAAGACQSYYGVAREIVDDSDCARFIRDIHGFCRITTVRDKLAEDVACALGLVVRRMPCVSIHAWRRNKAQPEISKRVALNFMRLGGHYDLDGRTDLRRWAESFVELERILRSRDLDTSLVAHDRAELNTLVELFPNRSVFLSEDYLDYFPYYAGCSCGVFNRVHGAMLLAGRGAPSLVIGNDSRARMADEVNLPRCHVSEADPNVIAEALIEHLSRPPINARLIQTEETAFQNIKELLSKLLQQSGLTC